MQDLLVAVVLGVGKEAQVGLRGGAGKLVLLLLLGLGLL